jgi:hypothetical protein
MISCFTDLLSNSPRRGRYTQEAREGRRSSMKAAAVGLAALGLVGAVLLESQLTHSLEAPGFNP